jgi:hypothetical protein
MGSNAKVLATSKSVNLNDVRTVDVEEMAKNRKDEQGKI